jgi:hypothetical protein
MVVECTLDRSFDPTTLKNRSENDAPCPVNSASRVLLPTVARLRWLKTGVSGRELIKDLYAVIKNTQEQSAQTPSISPVT